MLLKHKNKYHISIRHNKIEDYIIDVQEIKKAGTSIFYGEEKVDVSEYDEIILGFPIWWYVAPTIVNTFLEKFDFAGKKIILFATSGGSGFGNTVKELQISAQDAVIEEGKMLNHVSRQQIAEWVKTL